MTIYLDKDYVCHTKNADGRTAIETDVFDGKEKAYIEGYRFIPQNHSWTAPDGTIFMGVMIAPAKDYDRIMADIALDYLDDNEAEVVTDIFEEWKTNYIYEVGDRRQYNGLLYRCVQAHRSQNDWTPDITPALWVRTWTDPYPEWIQPTGAQDAYRIGDKCSYKGKHWINTVDYNVYAPDVYGWDEVT